MASVDRDILDVVPRVDLRAGPEAPGRRQIPRARLLPALVSVLLVAGYATGNPSLVLLGMGTIVVALFLRRIPWDLAVVAGGTTLLAGTIVVGTFAHLLQLNLISRGHALAATYLVAAVALFLLPSRAGRPSPVQGLGPGYVSVAFLPALVATATALLQGARVQAVQGWGFFGTDLINHTATLAQVQRDGNLGYTNAYPHGLHWLAAMASVPTAPLTDPGALLGYDLRLTGATTWLSLAFMIWAGTALTVRLAGVVGLPQVAGVLAGLVFGTAVLLSNTFMEGFVDQGAGPSLFAIAALYGLVLLALALEDRPSGLMVLLAAAAVVLMLLAHLWQALAVAPVVGVLAAAVPVTAGRRVAPAERPRWSTVAWGATAVLAVSVAAPPLLSVFHAGGAGLSGQEGEFGGQPWRALLPGIVCAVALLRWRRALWARLMLGTMLGLGAALAVLLHGAGHGLDLTQWYPLKACWFLALFLGPWLAVSSAWASGKIWRPVWSLLGSRSGTRVVGRATAVSLLVAVGIMTWLPWQLGPTPDIQGAWQPYHRARAAEEARPLFRGGAFDLARRYAFAFAPAHVVPYRVETNVMFNPFSTRIVGELLAFQTGQPSMAGTTDVCNALQHVAGHGPAVILTRAPAQVVRQDMATYGCAGRARVVTFHERY